MTSSPKESAPTYENLPYIDVANVRTDDVEEGLSHAAVDAVLLDGQFASQDGEREGMSIAEFNHIADDYAIAQKDQYDAMLPGRGRDKWWTVNETYPIGDSEIGLVDGFSPRSMRNAPLSYRNFITYKVGEGGSTSVLASEFSLRRKNDYTMDITSLGFESGANLNNIQTTLHANDIHEVKPKSRLSVLGEALNTDTSSSKVDSITARVKRETGLNLAGRSLLEVVFGDEPRICFFNGHGGLQGVPSTMEQSEGIVFVYNEKTRSFQYSGDSGQTAISLEEATSVVREILDLLPVPLKNPTDLR